MHISVLPRGIHPISHRTRAPLAPSAPPTRFNSQRDTLWSSRPSLQSSIPIFQTRTFHVSFSRFWGCLLKQSLSLRARVTGKQQPNLKRTVPSLLFLCVQLAFSQSWSTALAATLGFSAGALYQSDIASFKSYRLPPWFVLLSSRYISLIGETRAVRRTTRALPATDASETTPRLEDEVITTAHTSRTELSASPTTNDPRGATEQPGPSVMREWVNELTGRVDRASTGIRVPTEAEISQVMNIFPDLQRDVIVAALQRR